MKIIIIMLHVYAWYYLNIPQLDKKITDSRKLIVLSKILFKKFNNISLSRHVERTVNPN